MNHKLFFLALSVLGALMVVSGQTLAEEYSSSGNGSGSQNSIKVNESTNEQTQQSNSANIENESNVNSNTGGNETDGGTIKTGDSSIIEQILNKFNQNQSESDCCPTPSTTPKPTTGNVAPSATPKTSPTTVKAPTATTQPGQPTNTPAPESQPVSGGIGGPASAPMDIGATAGDGGRTKSEVLGLAATSGEFPWTQVLQVSGLICTVLGIKKLNGEMLKS